MFAPPSIDGWRRVPSWAWHRAGLEPPQARTVVETARRGDAIARAVAAGESGPQRDRVLTSLRGVGLWTAAETRIRALGDPDAVSVGDYHLAHEVGFALIGHRVDDDEMLQLLAPWAGQRQRVIRLIGLSGVHEARRGPRLHPEDHRDR
jgi:3-methyladenine DNA glycosylase/8-oxoguanine DNA glycosylase